VEVVRALMEGGADIDKAKNDGWTPLYIASEEGSCGCGEGPDGGRSRHRQG
jgi:hypothetical protein